MTTWTFTLFLFASVPFIGHVTNGRLFCNAACVVVETGYVTDGPVSQPFDGDNVTVRPHP